MVAGEFKTQSRDLDASVPNGAVREEGQGQKGAGPQFVLASATEQAPTRGVGAFPPYGVRACSTGGSRPIRAARVMAGQ